jgi:LPXTG-motif cell wall-anchored protein
VQVIEPGGATVAGWWKYGPTKPGGAPHYYGFGFDKNSQTGATISSVVTPAFGAATVVVLAIRDGGRGDEDTAADGSITDPGGASVLAAPVDDVTATGDTTTTTTSTTLPTATTIPATTNTESTTPAPAAATGGSLPRTGSDTASSLGLAAALLFAGGVFAAARKRGHRAPKRR